jgi:hypothetical protein
MFAEGVFRDPTVYVQVSIKSSGLLLAASAHLHIDIVFQDDRDFIFSARNLEQDLVVRVPTANLGTRNGFAGK